VFRAAAYSLGCHDGAMINCRLYRTVQSRFQLTDCTQLAGNADPKNCQKFLICAPMHNFVDLYLRN